jgi:hypothetical protein
MLMIISLTAGDQPGKSELLRLIGFHHSSNAEEADKMRDYVHGMTEYDVKNMTGNAPVKFRTIFTKLFPDRDFHSVSKNVFAIHQDEMWDTKVSEIVHDQGDSSTCFIRAAMCTLVMTLLGPVFFHTHDIGEAIREVLFLHSQAVFGEDGGHSDAILHYFNKQLLTTSKFLFGADTITSDLLSIKQFDFGSNCHDDTQKDTQTFLKLVQPWLAMEIPIAIVASTSGHAMALKQISKSCFGETLEGCTLVCKNSYEFMPVARYTWNAEHKQFRSGDTEIRTLKKKVTAFVYPILLYRVRWSKQII